VTISATGKRIRESSGTTSQREAQDLLARKIGRVEEGTSPDPSNRHLTVDDLYAGLHSYHRQKKNGNQSISFTF